MKAPGSPNQVGGETGSRDEIIRLEVRHGTKIIAGSEGSGGKHAIDPRLRRVGWGWCVLRADFSLIGSISGGLGSEQGLQTVPRAELQAAVHFLTHVWISDGVIVELHVDNSFVVNGLHALVAGWRATHGRLTGTYGVSCSTASGPCGT